MKVTMRPIDSIRPYKNNPRFNDEAVAKVKASLEAFSGSGSQIIACEQTGRRCRAMELQPVFVEVAVRRWEAFTGKKGVRIPSPNGKTIVPPEAAAAPRKPAKASASRGSKNPKKPLKRGHRDVLPT